MNVAILLSVPMLDELIDLHGEAAILSVRPYMPDSSGEILRWVVELDGKEPSDMDVRIDQGEPWVVMFLVRGDEQIEIGRWSSDERIVELGCDATEFAVVSLLKTVFRGVKLFQGVTVLSSHFLRVRDVAAFAGKRGSPEGGRLTAPRREGAAGRMRLPLVSRTAST